MPRGILDPSVQWLGPAASCREPRARIRAVGRLKTVRYDPSAPDHGPIPTGSACLLGSFGEEWRVTALDVGGAKLQGPNERRSRSVGGRWPRRWRSGRSVDPAADAASRSVYAACVGIGSSASRRVPALRAGEPHQHSQQDGPGEIAHYAREAGRTGFSMTLAIAEMVPQVVEKTRLRRAIPRARSMLRKDFGIADRRIPTRAPLHMALGASAAARPPRGRAMAAGSAKASPGRGGPSRGVGAPFAPGKQGSCAAGPGDRAEAAGETGRALCASLLADGRGPASGNSVSSGSCRF